MNKKFHLWHLGCLSHTISKQLKYILYPKHGTLFCTRCHTVHACAPMCTSRKYPYFPHSREWNFLGGERFCKTQKFKEMCEALFKFPEGLGVLKNLFCGRGMDIFWKLRNACLCSMWACSQATFLLGETWGQRVIRYGMWPEIRHWELFHLFQIPG